MLVQEWDQPGLLAEEPRLVYHVGMKRRHEVLDCDFSGQIDLCQQNFPGRPLVFGVSDHQPCTGKIRRYSQPLPRQKMTCPYPKWHRLVPRKATLVNHPYIADQIGIIMALSQKKIVSGSGTPGAACVYSIKGSDIHHTVTAQP